MKKLLLPGIALLALSIEAQAGDWYLNTAANTTLGVYRGSQTRDTLQDAGVRISADYLEQGGLSLGLNRTRIVMTTGNTNQQSSMLSGRMHFWPDWLSGKVITRIDVHRITNDDPTGDTSGVSVVAPQLGWLSGDASLYLDLGYANSKYVTGLNPGQFTPGIGFAFNDAADWLQLRAYLINGLDPQLTDNLQRTTALDASWTHYTRVKSGWAPASFTLKVSGGKRVYAVDMDAQSVANLGDIQTGGASLGMNWKLTHDTALTMLVSQSRYRNVGLNNDYKLNVGYAGLSIDW